jgi:hypothetical protein
VVHEVIQLDGLALYEDMVRQALASPAHAEPTVHWAEGIAPAVSLVPPTEDVVKEMLEGRLHYTAVMCLTDAVNAEDAFWRGFVLSVLSGVFHPAWCHACNDTKQEPRTKER